MKGHIKSVLVHSVHGWMVNFTDEYKLHHNNQADHVGQHEILVY